MPVSPTAPAPSPRTPRRQRAGRLGVSALAVLVAGPLLVVGSGQVAVARVTTGSMAPSVPTGSLVVGVPVGPGELRVGDLLTAHVDAVGGVVTHRVVALTRQGGRTTATTRGDANLSTDPWTTSLPDDTATRVVASVPRLGHVLGRGPLGVPLLALPLLVGLVTWAGVRRLLALLRDPA